MYVLNDVIKLSLIEFFDKILIVVEMFYCFLFVVNLII